MIGENIYDNLISKFSAYYKVPFALIKATIAIESSFNPQAFNPDDPQGGAIGLGQFLIGTAKALWKGFTVTPQMLFVPSFAIESIAKLQAENLKRYGGRIKDAIAAYNAGSVRKRKDGSYINQGYVNNVYAKYMEYLNQSDGAAATPGYIPPSPTPSIGDSGGKQDEGDNYGSVVVFAGIGIVVAAILIKTLKKS